MLTREQKKKIVEDLAKELKGCRAIVFSDYQGLPTRDIQELRAGLRKEGVGHRVVKLTLLKMALARAGFDTSRFDFRTSLAVSWSHEDEIAPPKKLVSFAKTHEQLKPLAAFVNGVFIGQTELKSLAALPSKRELLAQVVGVIAGPMKGLVNVLSGNMRGLLNVLSAIKEVSGIKN